LLSIRRTKIGIIIDFENEKNNILNKR